MSGWIESQGSLAFINDVLEITPAELLRKFKLWACAKDRTKIIDTAASLCTESVNTIIMGLQRIVGINNVTMHYKKYKTNIAFRSPAKITTMEEACVLWDALASGECMWVKLTRQEKDTHENKRQQRIASGKIPAKTRQPRSDKGKKRGPRKLKAGEKQKRGQGSDGEASEGEAGHDKENAPPQKKIRGVGAEKSRAACQLPPMPKSKEFVDSSSDDESS
ncbi:hypothetical protein DXG01_013833 [Tephrocybe rancida]|nr:hypothetical protein DXG01_013833 [Tephrocybe rancida]